MSASLGAATLCKAQVTIFYFLLLDVHFQIRLCLECAQASVLVVIPRAPKTLLLPVLRFFVVHGHLHNHSTNLNNTLTRRGFYFCNDLAQYLHSNNHEPSFIFVSIIAKGELL